MTIHADPRPIDSGPIDPTAAVPGPSGVDAPAPRPAVSPPPVDPLAVGALVAALPVPPVGLAQGIAALRRLRSGKRRGTGLAVAGVVVGGVLTAFWALVATLLVVGILAAAVSPVPTAPAPAPVAAPVPAPAAPGAATDPGVVSSAQLEQQLASGIGLPAGAVSCPSALPARAGASEVCRARMPSRGSVSVVVSVTSVRGDDVDLHYDLAPTGT